MTIPAQGPIQTSDGQPSRPWRTWMEGVAATVDAVRQSGTTAQRPTSGLWAGMPYFDTTLGTPIWYSGSGWVDATGTPA